jgi:hypothetical protein
MTMIKNHRLIVCTLVALTAAFVLQTASPRGATPKFYSDDPLQREPETQDASKVQEWEIDLFWDLAENLFGNPAGKTPLVKSRDVNSIDEVPDSSWFTNRIGTQTLSISDVVRGPLTGDGPAPGTWSVTRPKEAGFAPGFTMKDAKGDTWFVSFDANGFPEAATGAILAANKIFWALGYWQVENYLVHIQPKELTIADTADIKTPAGKRRKMKMSDLDDVLRRSHRSPDGSYRAIAGRALPGRTIGAFRYHDTRPDDPNDVIPHQDRRVLRALKVFGAWTNLVDMKAGNTLDSVITDNGKTLVRHYLQDVGSTFGTGANAPREYDEGWEYLFEGDKAMKRLITLGFFVQPWQTVNYTEHPAIGRFEGVEFDPTEWKPRVPTAAFVRARADDNFWAARRVMAFPDDMIRAIASAGQYHDEAAAKLLADVLIQRRDKIGQAYLNAINPVVNFALDGSDTLTFQNAAVDAHVANEPASGYTVHWFTFDNATGNATAIGSPTATTDRRVKAPGSLPSAAGAIVKVQVAATDPAHAPWAAPADAYFRRGASGWVLVGVERMPDSANVRKP